MSRKEYVSRINKVIDYINNNIGTELSLRILSSVANFSPYHFHRIFKAIMGENLYDFIQRIRIERAANLLLYQPDMTVTEIALNCGFSSSSIFARAFRAHFGKSATSYRESFSKNRKMNRKDSKEQNNPDLYYKDYPVTPGKLTERELLSKNVRIKSSPTYHVAYYRHLAGYQKGVYSQEISESFRKVENWVASRNLFFSATLGMGITYDNPDITASDKCRYDAAFTIPNDITEASGEIGVQDIQGGLYAVCRIEVSKDNPYELAIAKLGETVDYLYGEWLPDSGFQLADKPCIEIYYRGDEKQQEQVVIDYCLPIILN
ncbi:AraC family transcriptional regulator [Paenibacillus harenae]|uniref:AraC family transcriptional regulator n=1 Tax=Paenibacillus harenae TaxID=306543 RepID=UPI00041428CF|nr:GyrI-like domain-containing protein [Paenibacillus harenae]